MPLSPSSCPLPLPFCLSATLCLSSLPWQLEWSHYGFQALSMSSFCLRCLFNGHYTGLGKRQCSPAMSFTGVVQVGGGQEGRTCGNAFWNFARLKLWLPCNANTHAHAPRCDVTRCLPVFGARHHDTRRVGRGVRLHLPHNHPLHTARPPTRHIARIRHTRHCLLPTASS